MTRMFRPTSLEGRSFSLVRHGESTGNAANVFVGGRDNITLENGDALAIELSAKGKQEAQQLGNVLAAMKEAPSTVIHSGLARTRQTAQIALDILAAKRNLHPPVISDPALRERDWGTLEGKGGPVYDDVNHPGRNNPKLLGKGESEQLFAERSNRALEAAVGRQDGHPLVVAHLGTIKSLLAAYGVKMAGKPANGELLQFTPKPARATGGLPWDVQSIALEDGVVKSRPLALAPSNFSTMQLTGT